MGLFGFQARNKIAEWWGTLPRPEARRAQTFTELMNLSQASPRDCYAAALHEYRRAPGPIRAHRRYFIGTGRGFGEDAFHGAWWLLWQERLPERALEIGVFRGQTISLWTLAAQLCSRPCAVHGISPLEPVGDSVSEYPADIDYESDILDSFKRFRLPAPTLVRALSTDPGAIDHIAAGTWDLAYVDGNHDYDVAKSDLKRAWAALRPGGILVADDAALFLDAVPFKGAFMGHNGPSRAVVECEREGMHRLGTVGHMVFFEKPTS